MSMRNGGRIFPWQRGQSGQASPALSPATRLPQISRPKKSPTVTLPSIDPSLSPAGASTAGASTEQGVRKRTGDDEHEEDQRRKGEPPDKRAFLPQMHEKEGDQRRLHRGDGKGDDDVHHPEVHVGNRDGDRRKDDECASDDHVRPVAGIVLLHRAPPTPPGTAAGTGRSTPGPRNASITPKSRPGCGSFRKISPSRQGRGPYRAPPSRPARGGRGARSA